MSKIFKHTHTIKLVPGTATKHNFADKTEVNLNSNFIAGGGTMVMATCEEGMSQFVEYTELKLTIKKP